MDSMSFHPDTHIEAFLDQAKQQFFRTYSSVPRQQLEQLWQSRTVGSLNGSRHHNTSPAPHVPRTMSYDVPAMTPSRNMDRIHSAPAAVCMARSISSHSVDHNSAERMNQRSISAVEHLEEPSNDYIYSSSTSTQRSALGSIDESYSETMQEYSLADYVSTLGQIETDSRPSPANNHFGRLAVPQLTPQWNLSYDGSTSPSTPTTTGLATPPTLMSSRMSRQSSVNTQFLGDVSMMHVDSDYSSKMSVLNEDCFPSSISSDVDSKGISFNVDNSNFLAPFSGSPAESFFLSDMHVSSLSPSALALSPYQNQSNLVEDMQRSTSHSSSSSATSSNNPRHLRRDREIIAQSSRPIAPKANNAKERRTSPSNAKMVRVRSQDGTSKDVGVISKTPYVRPSHPKVRCSHCNEHPDGFRGEHELRRHFERAHASVRKVWVCVDNSPDKKFLANCKHCRNKKQYNAYYNAAAHLRRAHFNPRKPRGRRGKHDEKRGGIGGGDKPPMEELKEYWMKELDVQNIDSAESDSDEGNYVDTYDESPSTYENTLYAQYRSQESDAMVGVSQQLDSFGATSYADINTANQLYMNNFATSSGFENFEFQAPAIDYDPYVTQ